MVPFTVQYLIYISKNKTTREDLKNHHYNNVLNNSCVKNGKKHVVMKSNTSLIILKNIMIIKIIF